MIQTINDRVEVVDAHRALEHVRESMDYAVKFSDCAHSAEHVVAGALSAAMIAGFNLRGVVDKLKGGAMDVENLRNFRGLVGELSNDYAAQFARRMMVVSDFIEGGN